MDESGYEISKHRLVCENSRFYVYLDTVEKDGEVAVEDYMSVSPKARNEDQITGVVTLPVNNEKYGLLKIYRPPIKGFSWELPGGFMEQDESPQLSALRELKEEAELVCEEKDLVHLGSFHPVPGLISGKISIFSAEKCNAITQIEEAEFGISKFKWFAEEEIEDLIANGSIHDMTTVLAIHRRKILLSKSH